MKNKIEVSAAKYKIPLWMDSSWSALGRIITFRIDIKTIIIMKVGGLCNILHRVASFIMCMSFTSSLIIILTFRSLDTISAIFIQAFKPLLKRFIFGFCLNILVHSVCFAAALHPTNNNDAGLQLIRREEMFHLFSTFGPRSQTDKTFGRAFVENILLNWQQAHPCSTPVK